MKNKPKHQPRPRKPTQAEKEEANLRLHWQKIANMRNGKQYWLRMSEPYWIEWCGKAMPLDRAEILKCCSLADLRQYVEFEYAVQRVRGT